MSARRATPEARCVWLTDAQRDQLWSFADWCPDEMQDALLAVTAAWDAAPSDPAEAAAEAVRCEYVGLDDEECFDTAITVLVALGYPDGSPRQETPTP